MIIELELKTEVSKDLVELTVSTTPRIRTRNLSLSTPKFTTTTVNDRDPRSRTVIHELITPNDNNINWELIVPQLDASR